MALFQEFKKFALRGSIIELAIGFTVGAAFTTVAKSLVSDVIMPPVGLLLGEVDFTDLFIVLKEGSKGAAPYTTLGEAQAAGAVTLNYGIFINNVIALLLVAWAMFLIIRTLNRIDRRLEEQFGARRRLSPEEPANKKCPFCLSTIPYLATRCPNCTSQLDGTPAGTPRQEPISRA